VKPYVQLSQEELTWAAEQGLLDAAQVQPLWRALCDRAATGPAPADGIDVAGIPRPRFDFLHLAYYAGALLVIFAMSFFMTMAWEAFGGGGIAVIAGLYATAFVFLGRHLLENRNLRVPGGLLITMAVCMTPLIVYGLERWAHLWPQGDPGSYRDFHEWIKGGWVAMEVATVVAGLVALRFVRFPFLTAPVAFTLWYMSMDLAPLLLGTGVSWQDRAGVSAAVGAVMLLGSYLIDRRTREDFAYWGYLFGMLAFWGGLTSMKGGSELRKLVYALINVGLMMLSVLLGRRVFMVFGALGVMGYLGYLSYQVFQDSLAFPFVLTFGGLLIIFSAVKYHKHRLSIESALLAGLPPWLLRALPRERGQG
jgi:hypothetical protein